MKFSVALFVCLVAAAASASAAPVLYNINFTETSGFGPAPTAGSFQYDATTQTFSTFSVQWNGLTFDLTAAANSPNVGGACDTAAPNAADYFAYLNGNRCIGAGWQASSTQSDVTFRLGGVGRSRDTSAPAALAQATMVTDGGGSAGGAFSIESAASGVPEPSSWVLMLGSGGLLAWTRRNRRDEGTADGHPVAGGSYEFRPCASSAAHHLTLGGIRIPA